MGEQPKKVRRSICLFLAALVGSAVAIYLFKYMGNTMDKVAGSNGAEAAGTAIGVALVTPSTILGAIGTVFAWVGWATKKRGFALVAGILYAVGCVLMFAFIPFHIGPMILSFIGYGTMKEK